MSTNDGRVGLAESERVWRSRSTPTLQQQIECVAQEIRKRRRYYPGLVDRGVMKQEEAGYQVVTLEAVLETLQVQQRTLQRITGRQLQFPNTMEAA